MKKQSNTQNTELSELKKRVGKLESDNRRSYIRLIISILINILDKYFA